MFVAGKSNGKDNVVCKVCFPSEFVSKLRAKASTEVTKPCSRFAIVCAQLWRAITKARGLQDHVTTEICISVDGRNRMESKVPNEFFGNLVLWVFPRSKVEDLINRPLGYTVELIRSEVEKVDNNYFQSFIDFASSGIISKEGYVSIKSIKKRYFCPNVVMASSLRLPFFDMDFGTGKPYYFMPSYIGTEGIVLVLPFCPEDESIEAVVSLFPDNVDAFERSCYSVD